MDRRDFLKGAFFLGVGLALPDYLKAEELVVNDTNYKVDIILTEEDVLKYERSLGSVGKKEIDFFNKFFELGDIKQFLIKVENLQEEFGFIGKSSDGILGPASLKQIYIEYYSKNQDKLDVEIKKRLSIYNEMLGYKKNKKAKSGKLDVFSTNTYYAKDVGINKENTFINENLFGKVPDSIDEKINKIIVSKIEGKNVLSFYVEGELYLATYVSPGLLDHKTSRLKTIGKKHPDMHHYSSEYPEVNIKKKIFEKGGAVMPYAVHIDGKEWIHGSDGPINGNPASHGCIRTPLFYVREIHEKVKELGIKNVIIDTTGIYS